MMKEKRKEKRKNTVKENVKDLNSLFFFWLCVSIFFFFVVFIFYLLFFSLLEDFGTKKHINLLSIATRFYFCVALASSSSLLFFKQRIANLI